MDYQKYQDDLAEVLRTFDKEEILSFFKKHNVPVPSSDLSFWGAVHKMRLALPQFTEQEKEFSRVWLRSNGMESKPAISENLQNHMRLFSAKMIELTEQGMGEDEAALAATKEANALYPLSAVDIETLRRAEQMRSRI